MKKIILILAIIIISIIPAIAGTVQSALNDIENNLFGYSYKNETETARIERIEDYIYGNKKTGNIETRIKDIRNDIGLLSAEEKTKQKEQLKEKRIEKELLSAKEDATVEYPMVDKIEQELFQTTYKNENIYARLDRLEKTVFNKVSNEPLTNRVDKLASIIVPQKKQQEPTYTQEDINNLYSPDLQTVTDENIPFQLAVLEQSMLNKAYDGDNIANRLNRLEQKLFNRNFPNDNDVSRLQRVLVAYEAKKDSYKYENNRKMQKMATISQLGGFLLMLLAILI